MIAGNSGVKQAESSATMKSALDETQACDRPMGVDWEPGTDKQAANINEERKRTRKIQTSGNSKVVNELPHQGDIRDLKRGSEACSGEPQGIQTGDQIHNESGHVGIGSEYGLEIQTADKIHNESGPVDLGSEYGLEGMKHKDGLNLAMSCNSSPSQDGRVVVNYGLEGMKNKNGLSPSLNIEPNILEIGGTQSKELRQHQAQAIGENARPTGYSDEEGKSLNAESSLRDSNFVNMNRINSG
ncbi:hypothetical protein Ancab_013469 [Ancistrocladus abbreviatus]